MYRYELQYDDISTTQLDPRKIPHYPINDALQSVGGRNIVGLPWDTLAAKQAQGAQAMLRDRALRSISITHKIPEVHLGQANQDLVALHTPARPPVEASDVSEPSDLPDLIDTETGEIVPPGDYDPSSIPPGTQQFPIYTPRPSPSDRQSTFLMQKLLLAAMAAKQKQETAHSHELLDAHEKELALKAQLEDLRDDYARLLISKQKPLSQQDLYPKDDDPEEEPPDTGGASGSGGYSTSALGPRPQRPPIGPMAHGVGTSYDLITPAPAAPAASSAPPATHAAEITTEGFAERPGGDGAPQIQRPVRVRRPYRSEKTPDGVKW